MGRRREYDIAFVGLKPGIHEFTYPISDKFFTVFQEQDFKNCKANVRLLLEKQTGFFLLTFEIGGTLEVTCDRCNGNLPLELWDEFKITVKMVEEPNRNVCQIQNEDTVSREVLNAELTIKHLLLPSHKMVQQEKLICVTARM